ncbi:hypothetical protein GCM10022267_83460 [Lentzea roselyniae]|uniref:Uncharacterized protein n=2 Tax=Lentzea roselyniae TaxID=531940 RepID=A0ABP7CBP2_9PSEU
MFTPEISWRPQLVEFDGSHADAFNCTSTNPAFSNIGGAHFVASNDSEGVNNCLELQGAGGGTGSWHNKDGSLAGTNTFDWHIVASSNGFEFEGVSLSGVLAGVPWKIEIATIEQFDRNGKQHNGGCFLNSSIKYDVIRGTIQWYQDPGLPRITSKPSACKITKGPGNDLTVSWTNTITGVHWPNGTVNLSDTGGLHTVDLSGQNGQAVIVILATEAPRTADATASGGTFTAKIAHSITFPNGLTTFKPGTTFENTDNVIASNAEDGVATASGGPSICELN